MATVLRISDYAEAAQAAYATIPSSATPGQLSSALQERDAGFAATQATSFSSMHSVVLQYNDDAAGFAGNGTSLSVTVFQNTATQQLTLAIRGT